MDWEAFRSAAGTFSPWRTDRDANRNANSTIYEFSATSDSFVKFQSSRPTALELGASGSAAGGFSPWRIPRDTNSKIYEFSETSDSFVEFQSRRDHGARRVA